MPCTTTSLDEDYREKISETNMLSAALCAALTVLGDNALDKLDYKEAGITKEALSRWWVDHQEKDRQRRAREQAQERKRQAQLKAQEIRQSAMSKLTQEERNAFGFP